MTEQLAFDTLRERIGKDTAREVESIRAQAEKEAQAIEASAREHEARLLRSGQERCRMQCQSEARKRVSARETELKRAYLEERELLLDEVLSDLEERLLALSPSEEAAMLAGVLGAAAAEIPSGIIRFSRRSAELLRGKTGGFAVSVDDSLERGFVAESADGEKVLDLSLATLVERFWAAHRVLAAKTMFAPNGAEGTGK